jgi:hypothetical protein
MKRARFAEEQIIGILREQEAGQGADLLETQGLDDLARGVIEASYSWSSSFLTAAIWRSSNSVKRRPRQRSVARMRAPNMSLSTGFSPKPFGMIFSRRRSSTNSRKIRRPDEAPMRDRQSQVRDARLEIVLETAERARQEISVVGADAGRQLPGDRTRGRLIAGGDPRLDLRPQIGRDLGCEVAHPVRKATWRAERGKHSSIARMIPGTDAALPEQFSPSVTFDAMVMFHDNGHHGGRLGQGVILAKVMVFGRASHAAHTGEDRQAFVATSATFCKIDAQLCGRTRCRICGSSPTESLLDSPAQNS